MKTVDERRAAAIRRHRSNPAVVAVLKERIRAMVLGDDSAKAIGFAVKLSAGKACRWIHVLGFRRMYVTAEERAAIMKRRAEAQQNSPAAKRAA